MYGEEDKREIYVPTLWDQVQPAIASLAPLAMGLAYGAAGLAAAYLLFGVLSGSLSGFDAQPHPERLRIIANIQLAGNVLRYGLGAGALATALLFYAEDAVGYALFIAAALVGLGIPYVARMTANGQNGSHAVAAALVSFVGAAYIPGILGVILISRDIVLRLIGAVRGKTPEIGEMTFGGEAEAEPKPTRLSLLAKCWEGPYCREFIRPHCPIFLSRKACWREKRGCYCEEEIVSAAASRINGVVLDMAPDPKYNFANATTAVGGGNANAYRKPELSYAQKVQRCKFCVIYNEHEREKYQRLVPVVMLGAVGLCALFAQNMRGMIGGAMHFSQSIVDRFSFGGTVQIAQLSEPSTVVEWAFVAAFTIIIVSKFLQVLEWMCFKAKI